MKNKTYFPQEYNGLCVVRREGESYEDLLKRFKKKYSKSGIIKELKEKAYYEKPSDKKRRKRMIYIRQLEKEKEKQERYRLKYSKHFSDKKGDELE